MRESARNLGLRKSTLHRLLQTLTAEGLLAASGPVIDDLRNRTGETAAIADSRVEIVPAPDTSRSGSSWMRSSRWSSTT